MRHRGVPGPRHGGAVWGPTSGRLLLALLIAAASLAVAAFFLWTEHRAHLFGLLPYALAAAFVLLHLLLHRIHWKDRSSTSGTTDAENQGRVRGDP